MDEWEDIDFEDDREGTLFTVTIYRTSSESSDKIEGGAIKQQEIEGGWEKSSGKSSDKILELLLSEPKMTISRLAESLSISTRAVEKQIANLKERKLLERIEPAKGGYWHVKSEDKAVK